MISTTETLFGDDSEHNTSVDASNSLISSVVNVGKAVTSTERRIPKFAVIVTLYT